MAEPAPTASAGTASFAASQRAGDTPCVHARCAVPDSSSRPTSAPPANAATAREAYPISRPARSSRTLYRCAR
ncbi:hypothetical protein IQ63_37305 [Streptomyces acidiscabies]|uniref:Uncharacterized protein n=1 Tax=Streptomyces acidiscabies TaxID=42234 RepID=A0A0L0JL51_9ACTN|nr:hypothetical protein IQ63_37305 [Streptomyces acidiscabies]